MYPLCLTLVYASIFGDVYRNKVVELQYRWSGAYIGLVTAVGGVEIN